MTSVAGDGPSNITRTPIQGSFTVKDGLAKMLKGGVIMDVVNVEQARIAEEAGACAVMVSNALRHVRMDL